MMSIEGPLIAAVIARMSQPKENLAAYGIAFAFALIIEAPVIMMLSASTALVQNPQSFHKLRRFTYWLNGLITISMLILLIPQIFDGLLLGLMHLDATVVRLTYPALFILLVWPGAIGYRRFYQGILIRYGYTRRVAYGTVVRLISMAATVALFYKLNLFPGAYLGAAALSVGVTFEAIASRLMAREALKQIFSTTQENDSREKLTYGSITQFYYPLALTSILGLALQPALTFFMGQGRHALESLAVWPVVNSFVFIFRSFGLSYQEVAISLMGRKGENYHQLKRFAQMIAGFVSGSLAIIALTSLLIVWMRDVSGLHPDLAQFTFRPVHILILMPAFSVWISFQRAVLVVRRSTGPITGATAIEVGSAIIIMYLMVFYSPLSGVLGASIALMIGRGGAIGYLWRKNFKEKLFSAE